jgi:hypothetical protein
LTQADIKVYTSTFENNSAAQVNKRVVRVVVSVNFPYFSMHPFSALSSALVPFKTLSFAVIPWFSQEEQSIQ